MLIVSGTSQNVLRATCMPHIDMSLYLVRHMYLHVLLQVYYFLAAFCYRCV
jgi:hypothetical protein